MMEQARVSIGVASRITGINVNTLRMWERRYQLGASQRSTNGHREFTSADIDKLKLVKNLIDKGVRIGDIVKLDTSSLNSLLIETGQNPSKPTHKDIEAIIVGKEVSHYFNAHLKRYPQLRVNTNNTEGFKWLKDNQHSKTDLLVIQLHSINHSTARKIIHYARQKIHVIVIFFYCTIEIEEVLQKEGIISLKGKLNPTTIDNAIKKVERLSCNLSVLDENNAKFDLNLPSIRPRQFTEQELIAAEDQANKLNCECPPHLTDLIRRLSAFEEYSKQCGSDNWKQAAVHASIYAQANQSRYLMEKALQLVLDE